jgi:toxin ParE1/3/4
LKPVIFSPQADRELESIGDFIAEESALKAKSVVGELRARAFRIGHSPRAYPLRNNLMPGLRMMVWRPFLVLYRETITHVEIVHIVHGARDLRRLFED